MSSDDTHCHCRLSALTQEEFRHPQRVEYQSTPQARVTAYLYDGILVAVEKRRLQAPKTIACYDTTPCMWLIYQMWGESSIAIDKRRLLLKSRQMVIANGTYVNREMRSAPGQEIGQVCIRLDERFLGKYFQPGGMVPPKALRPLLERNASFVHAGTITPAAQLALSQLCHFPFDASLEMLFAESRALDVVCDSFASFGGETASDDIALSRQDIEKLHYAREVLLENVTAPPPGIGQLARDIGMNDFKLKKGFRLLFKTSIHTYHRNARLDLARTLLNEGVLNVCEVACAVGYSNPSHFSRAFHNLFHINPGAYLRDIRNKGFHLAAAGSRPS